MEKKVRYIPLFLFVLIFILGGFFLFIQDKRLKDRDNKSCDLSILSLVDSQNRIEIYLGWTISKLSEGAFQFDKYADNGYDIDRRLILTRNNEIFLINESPIGKNDFRELSINESVAYDIKGEKYNLQALYNQFFKMRLKLVMHNQSDQFLFYSKVDTSLYQCLKKECPIAEWNNEKFHYKDKFYLVVEKGKR